MRPTRAAHDPRIAAQLDLLKARPAIAHQAAGQALHVSSSRRTALGRSTVGACAAAAVPDLQTSLKRFVACDALGVDCGRQTWLAEEIAQTLGILWIGNAAQPKAAANRHHTTLNAHPFIQGKRKTPARRGRYLAGVR
jgi:hypothetical protein